VPTRFGRLVFLSALRDPLGHYSHPSLAERIGPVAADRALAHQHHLVFMEWLRLNLADQKADIDEYLRDAGTRAAALPYRDLAPATAHAVEKQLYLADLEVIVQLLSFAQGALSMPDASPPR
jgi:hypothetical protein